MSSNRSIDTTEEVSFLRKVGDLSLWYLALWPDSPIGVCRPRPLGSWSCHGRGSCPFPRNPLCAGEGWPQPQGQILVGSGEQWCPCLGCGTSWHHPVWKDDGYISICECIRFYQLYYNYSRGHTMNIQSGFFIWNFMAVFTIQWIARWLSPVS